MHLEVDLDVVTVAEGRDALPRTLERVGAAVIDVGANVLGESLARFMAELDEVFVSLPETVGPFEVGEVELSVAIGGTGDFRLASAHAESGLKITLRRPEA